MDDGIVKLGTETMHSTENSKKIHALQTLESGVINVSLGNLLTSALTLCGRESQSKMLLDDTKF